MVLAIPAAEQNWVLRARTLQTVEWPKLNEN